MFRRSNCQVASLFGAKPSDRRTRHAFPSKLALANDTADCTIFSEVSGEVLLDLGMELA